MRKTTLKNQTDNQTGKQTYRELEKRRVQEKESFYI